MFEIDSRREFFVVGESSPDGRKISGIICAEKYSEYQRFESQKNSTVLGSHTQNFGKSHPRAPHLLVR